MVNKELPGVSPRWIDKDKGYDKKHACYPVEIINAINRARDSGVPASIVESAIRSTLMAQGESNA